MRLLYLVLIFLSASTLFASTRKRADQAFDLGKKYLIENQNPDGSWGSARRTKGLNVYAPGAASHHSLRCTTTSLAVMALLETSSEDPKAMAAAKRGRDFLFAQLSKVKRPGFDLRWVVNNWAHCYSLRALVRILKDKTLSENNEGRIRELIASQVKRLERYQFPGGGWGYYDFDNRTQQPGGDATSFLTGSILIALKEVEALGLPVNKKMVQAAVRKLKFFQKPDFSYIYSYDRLDAATWGINNKNGSLARSQVCNLALYTRQEGRVDEGVLSHWIKRITSGHQWLGHAIKNPKPHSGFHYIASYFFYYGYFYASSTLEHLKTGRVEAAEGLAKIMIDNQEKNGAWFDFPFYDYGHAYGTSYGLMSLYYCRKFMEPVDKEQLEKEGN